MDFHYEMEQPNQFDNDANETYSFKFMPKQLQSFFSEIFDKASIDDVFKKLSNFIIENIEPIGWKGVWIPSSDEFPDDTRFIVKVTNVFETLEASIIILDSASKSSDDSFEMIGNNFEESERVVPLRELFVVSNDDEEKMFCKTAFIIEILRLFYDHLWRPWDDLDENNSEIDFYSDKLLPRLNLILDIKNNLIEEKRVNRYETILSEATSIRKRMDSIKNNAKQNQSEDELLEDEYENEIKALEYVRLKLKLEDYQREMGILEDFYLRTLYDTIMPETSPKESNVPTMHLVSSSRLDYDSSTRLLKILGEFLNDNQTEYPLKWHNSFQQALFHCSSGDTIFLAKGTYVQSLSWIEKDVDICGIEPDVELSSSKDCGDIFLFIDVPNHVKIRNLTINVNHMMDKLIVLKSGHLILENCVFNCKNLVKDMILILNDSKLTKINTDINRSF